MRLRRVHTGGLRVAVVGHVEWVQFARVEHVPRAGEVVHASDPFEEPAGGGAVAAVQLARLAGAASLVTVLGDDVFGSRSAARLLALGVDVRASMASVPSRRAVTLVDDAGERTITTFGPRLEPRGAEERAGESPGAQSSGAAPSGKARRGPSHERWSELEELDAVYFTAGDEAELRLARARARVLVASPRARDALGHGVRLDALVLSGDDEIELRAAEPALAEAELVVWTEGERGGRYRRSDGATGGWQAAPLPGKRVDSYGCGDSFAAGLTYGLGAGLALDGALALAARCGAMCATGSGPYERQLSRADLGERRAS
ncbi:MAG TPA: PfkB family carbohydrate kinase [Solirubrobacteraceae bacterium]|nr:PfkB family carbohydrate kinase [Solirubrobacteraceae bacterium]